MQSLPDNLHRLSVATADAGSFRDRGGRVYRLGDRILRSVEASASERAAIVATKEISGHGRKLDRYRRHG